MRGLHHVPIFAKAVVGEIYGRSDRQRRQSKLKHFYLPGTHEGILQQRTLAAIG